MPVCYRRFFFVNLICQILEAAGEVQYPGGNTRTTQKPGLNAGFFFAFFCKKFCILLKSVIFAPVMITNKNVIQ